MKILVTGARGFIGKHLVNQLDLHHHVIAVDREHGDLRRTGVAVDLIAQLVPEIVIHLAAKVGRLFGEDDVMETVADNAGMTALVAKACGDAGVRMVYASTSEVYGDQGDAMCREDGPLALPHNTYGLSKAHGEDYCRLYAPADLTIWRISMPFGPGLPAGRGRAAIINMIDQATRGVPIPVHRGAERSWCWIGDTVRAMELTLHEPGGVFNLGRDDNATPMTTVARIACDLAGADYGLIAEVDAPARQTVVKRLATEKIRALGWLPEVSLEQGMALTRQAMYAGEQVAA